MHSLRLAALLCLSLVLLSCTQQRSRVPSAATLPRADPGYVQWLERQAMLGNAPQLTALVSGTDKGLRASSVDTTQGDKRAQGGTGRGDRIDTLLAAADTWLWVHAPSMVTARMRPVWEELADPRYAQLMDALGLRGLYVASTAESGGIWEYDRRRSLAGDDVTSLSFGPHAGTDKQFETFAGLAARRQWQLGADIIPPSTGLGPDFFLAARQVRDYPGAYMMLEAPEALWSLLPEAAGQWQGAPLQDAHVTLLAEKGVLPPALARDELARGASSWLQPGGWAVTGPIRGVDGVNRRWLYRYHRSPLYAQLHWDDPSGAARKILSASVIRQVGLLQHTLAGLHTEALVGLDPVDGPVDSPTLEPAPSALRDLSREVRRYGGWSVQLDPLPLLSSDATSRRFAPQHSGADFMADSVTFPAAENALRSGDATALREALAQSLSAGLDQRRLARRVAGFQGLPQSEDAAAPQTTARRHLLLTLFRGGLPGLLLLSGQDLAGSLSAQPLTDAHAEAAGWSLLLPEETASSTRQGTARAATLYPPVPQQWETPGSYAHTVSKITEARSAFGLARGRLLAVARTSHKGSVGFWVHLPEGSGSDAALVLANFSASPVKERVPLPPRVQGRIYDLLRQAGQHGQGEDRSEADASLTVELAPYQCVWLGVFRRPE